MHSLPDLPDSTAHEIYARLCRSLPHPTPDTPEARAARTDDAMAAVASLYPTDPFMARIAADIVALEAHATDSFDQATHLRADLAGTQRCRAQAISMLRQMRNLWRDYRNVQAERDKAFNEMHPATMARGGYWFKYGTGNINALCECNRALPYFLPKSGLDPFGSETSSPRPPLIHLLGYKLVEAGKEPYAIARQDRAGVHRALGELPLAR
jgi:hypothetical protein